MKYYRRALYDKFVHFILLSLMMAAQKHNFGEKWVGLCVKRVKKISPDWPKEEEQIHQLLQLFYGDWGFHCDPEDYFYARNLYLPYVFEHRQGMPVTLGAMVFYLAEALDLPIYPVNFPTQLILRAEVRDEVAFIDPWDGTYISQEKLQQLYEGAFGFWGENSTRRT